MGFVSRIFSPPSQPSPQPAPAPAPVQLPPQAADAAGDARDRLRGGAARRRGAGTILTGDQTTLGATQGKTLLGA